MIDLLCTIIWMFFLEPVLNKQRDNVEKIRRKMSRMAMKSPIYSFNEATNIDLN